MTKEAIKKFCKALASLTVVAGGAGSISCLPFAFSSDLRLLAVTGIYFVAGAVMITGGLATYAILIKDE